MIKETAPNGEAGANGTPETGASNGVKDDSKAATKVSVRCVLATGSVDLKVKVFAS